MVRTLLVWEKQKGPYSRIEATQSHKDTLITNSEDVDAVQKNKFMPFKKNSEDDEIIVAI